MTVLARAATAYLASYRTLLPRMNMASSPPSAAARAAAARIRHLSSASSSALSSSSTSEVDVDANGGGSHGSLHPPGARPLYPPKRMLLLRHGQAVHNPRAEAARESGCSFDDFLRLMEEDDAYDAALTELGEAQALEARRCSHVQRALRNVEMVVSSPLSRALHTADLVHPPSNARPSMESSPRRICLEHFREINGKLLNAQRRPRSELERTFPGWCFRQIPAEDETWSPELETREACSERGYRGLLWVLQQAEEHVLLVCHGGLLNYTMNSNPRVVLVDGRRDHMRKERCITKRFGNCEMREFVATVWHPNKHPNDDRMSVSDTNVVDAQPVITLEEVEMDGSHTLNDEKEEKVEMM